MDNLPAICIWVRYSKFFWRQCSKARRYFLAWRHSCLAGLGETLAVSLTCWFNSSIRCSRSAIIVSSWSTSKLFSSTAILTSACLISWSSLRAFSTFNSLYLIVHFFQTKEYLFALARILVPLINIMFVSVLSGFYICSIGPCVNYMPT